MSLIHSTIVGHFDSRTLNARDRRPTRPIDTQAAKALLAEFPDHVASRGEFYDGYVECWWADRSFQISDAVYQYAYRLAESQGCIAAETPICTVTYPEHAKLQQAKLWEQQAEKCRHLEGQTPKREPSPFVGPIFNPPKPAPCPYCGAPLRTAIARQCRFCKMDWHDPQNIHRRG